MVSDARGRDLALPVGRVLVVEDDPQLRALLLTALHDEGYAVEGAETGEAALALLAGEGPRGAYEPHVILLDLRMPGMGGVAFAEEYRRRPGRHAPIIVITASTALAAAARAVEPADVVAKPFDLTDLLDRIAAALGGV